MVKNLLYFVQKRIFFLGVENPMVPVTRLHYNPLLEIYLRDIVTKCSISDIPWH